MTLADLIAWLEKENVNPAALRVGPTWRALADGYAIVQEGESFLFFYVERGRRRHVETFAGEEAAVARALEHLRRDRWAFAHVAGLFPTAAAATALRARLAARGIASEGDSIPYGGPGDRRYRVFVFGRDANRLEGRS